MQWCNEFLNLLLLPDFLLFIGKKSSNGSYSRRGESDKRTEVRFIHCPTCKSRADVPSGGVQYFPPNYSIQHQMVLATLNSSSTHLLCDLCPNEITVSLSINSRATVFYTRITTKGSLRGNGMVLEVLVASSFLFFY